MKARTLALSVLSLTISIPLAAAYSGDLTFYAPAMSSTSSACNMAATQGESIVAISKARFTAPNPNDDPLCGSTITIYNPAAGISVPNVKVVDKCNGCDADSIDVNVELFKQLGFDPAQGRVTVDWGGNTVGGKRSVEGGLEPLEVVAKRELGHPHGRVQ